MTFVIGHFNKFYGFQIDTIYDIIAKKRVWNLW